MWFMRSFRNAVPQPPGHQGLLPLVAFLLAALLASALVCLGSYGLQRRALEQQAKEELSYLALAQRNHLESMLDRCLAQAEVAAGEPFLVSRLQALSRPGAGRDPALEARLQAIAEISRPAPPRVSAETTIPCIPGNPKPSSSCSKD